MRNCSPPELQVIHRVITRFLIKQARLKRGAADTGAVTLIQRFGSAAIVEPLVIVRILAHLGLSRKGTLPTRAPPRSPVSP